MNKTVEYNFRIEKVGEGNFASPIGNGVFVEENERVPFKSCLNDILSSDATSEHISLEKAGPRKNIYFTPNEVNAAILTAGGLCPGLNDVIKGLVNTLCMTYGVSSVKGLRYGYLGLAKYKDFQPINLTTESVDDIHSIGGSILGSSRGNLDISRMIDALNEMGINILFCVGGDGTLKGAKALSEEIQKRNLKIVVCGVPKTIDNDISFTDRSFGFESAVYATNNIIECAHNEAKAAYNGIGLVKLMGRESGFIAAHAALANSVVNYCLIPEEDFELEGKNSFLEKLFKRLEKKHHAVVVVAEGAGQKFFSDNKKLDKSGNIILNDIGIFLKNKITEYAKKKSVEVNVKYFDPSYIIRSGDAIGTDAVFCIMLAQNAVHGAMTGRTSFMIGYHNGQFVHVPLSLAVIKRKKIDINGALWQSVVQITGQNIQ